MLQYLLYLCIDYCIMDTIKRTGTIFLVILLLFANIGLSVVRHICHASQEENIAAFTEFEVGESPSCCCAGEGTPVTKSQDPLTESFNPVPCCSDITQYIKADITSLPAGKSITIDQTVIQMHLPLILLSDTGPDQVLVRLIPESSQPPPLPGGKDLVLFLHQVKIPALCC